MEVILSHSPDKRGVIDYQKALQILQAALDHALKLGVNVSVSVLDGHAREVAFVRMPNSPFSSDAVARGKAYASVSFRAATADLEKKIPFEKVVQLASASDHPIVMIEGGRPIVLDGTVLGAVGVSGATSAQDDEIALLASQLFNS